MTLKNLLSFSLLSLIFINTTNAQDLDYLTPENRIGQLFFKVSSEYRITPLTYTEPIKPGVTVDPDLQNSGMAFAYNLDMFITKNLNLGFSNSLRYDYLGGDIAQIKGDFGKKPSNRGLIIGYHFYLDYHFKIFKESELFIRVGKSLLNRGTNINSKTTFFDSEGNVLTVLDSSSDFSYEPSNLGLGWKKRKIEIMLGFYTSSISEYFEENVNFTVPYFKFSYNLGRL
nr:hypothetical protein [uncultured Psychroserpens sp.]